MCNWKTQPLWAPGTTSPSGLLTHRNALSCDVHRRPALTDLLQDRHAAERSVAAVYNRAVPGEGGLPLRLLHNFYMYVQDPTTGMERAAGLEELHNGEPPTLSWHLLSHIVGVQPGARIFMPCAFHHGALHIHHRLEVWVRAACSLMSAAQPGSCQIVDVLLRQQARWARCCCGRGGRCSSTARCRQRAATPGAAAAPRMAARAASTWPTCAIGWWTTRSRRTPSGWSPAPPGTGQCFD